MEKEVTIAGTSYVIQKLPLGDASEVLLRVMKLAGASGADLNLGAAVAAMSMKDLNFMREKLLGANCHMMNETGDGVPMTPRIVDNHFNGHPGRLLNLLLQCLLHNYSDFLADLDLPSLGVDLAAIAQNPE